MLLQQEKERDEQEFMDWIFHTFHPLMWHTAKKYCRKEALWEEIIQESLVRLLSCVPHLRSLPEEKTAGYIFATVRHSAGALQQKEGVYHDTERSTLGKL